MVEQAIGLWGVPPSPESVPVVVKSKGLREESVEDSITVASPNIENRATMDSSINPSSTTTAATSEPASPNSPNSPASSTSSLSDPPSEPDSPMLFALDRSHIKPEPTGGSSSDISEEIPELVPPNVSSASDSTPSRVKGGYYKPRVRGIDVCADPDTVEAYRIAKAFADAEGEDLAIIGSRPLRSSNRLSSSKKIASPAGPSAPNPSLNGASRNSKKRARGSVNSQSSLDPTRVMIKQEFRSKKAGMGNYVLTTSPPELKKRLGRPPGKKQKVGPVPKLIPLSSQEISSRLQNSSLDRGKQSPMENLETPSASSDKGVRKKKSPRWSWVELKDDLGLEQAQTKLEQGQTKRCASFSPSFSYRCTSPFGLDKSSPHQPRAWSEGAGEPRNSTPVVPQIDRKNGILTDAVTITESRLRPRKSFGNPTLEFPMPRKPKQPRTLLKLEKVPKHNLAIPKKRALDDETEESSDESLTQDDWVSDENSDMFEKTDGDDDDGDDDGDEDDDDDDGLGELEADSKAAAMAVKTEHGQGTGVSTPAKKQKLNSGKGSKKGKNKKQIPPITDIKDLDDRLWPGAAVLADGIYMIPRACRSCLESHCFCNRKMPCNKCIIRGTKCSRAEGLVQAKPKQDRPKGKKYWKKEPNFTEFMAPELLELSPSPPPQKKRRGRPPKPLSPSSPSAVGTPKIKKEVISKIKKEREIKEVPIINLIDPQEGKPPGIRRPEVWCESRQELCESLPYYRSYQSGCYGHDGLVHGYLLDGFPAPRDYIDGKVVISHTGGKSTADNDGQRRLLTNQTPEDKVIKYLFANMKNQLPLVMIMGQHCCNSPSKLPHRYCVMDWFKVTAGWAERDPRSRFTRWKFRFEKLDTSVDGWWASRPSAESDPREEMTKASCNTCKTESPHVYEEGWMCLKPECIKFWTLDGKDAPVDVKYTYNFLNCRTTWPSEFLTAPNPLGPSLNLNRDVFFDGGDVSRVFWKGMCCPKCGRLNCREAWAGWRCLSCDFKLDPPRTIFDAVRLADPHRPVFTGPAIPANICHDDIAYERFVKDGMTVIQYQLGDCGTVTHILANQSSNTRPKDADWLFREYQSNEMPFKRFPLGNHKSTGRLLTQQFTFNCGAPYKFIVDVESHPFDKSPPVVSRALEVIRDRVSLVHPEADFNEILNVGYFEKQKMDYHDDGEAGLGETVASISLGAPARMRFRIKARYTSERHCWTTRPPTPPLQLRSNGPNVKGEPRNDGLDLDEDEDEDLEHNEDVIGGQQPPTPPGRGPKKVNKGRVKLDLCLSHGDVMVMKGRDIQKYWEHSVIPQGLFRIAATARFITEKHPGMFKQTKSEAATAEPRQPTMEPESMVQNPPTGATPGANSATSNTPVHSKNMGSDYPTCPIGYAPNTPIPDFKLEQSPSGAEPGVIPAGVDSRPHGSINVVANPNTFLAPVPQLQNPFTGAEPAQRLPNFPRADILHSIDQPIGFNNSISLTLSSSQVFPENCRETPKTGLPEFYDAHDFQMPSSFHPAGHPSGITYRPDLNRGRNYSTDGSAEMDPPKQKLGLSDSGRTTKIGNWTSEQETQTSVPTENMTPGPGTW